MEEPGTIFDGRSSGSPEQGPLLRRELLHLSIENAGQDFLAIKGAPGGDDYHSICINPQNSDILFLGVDQGATISVNGGMTWRSWYNARVRLPLSLKKRCSLR